MSYTKPAIMATHTRDLVKVSLDDKIRILNRNAVEVSPAKQVFRIVSAILTLVKNKMINNKDSVQLSEHCFSVCEALKTAIQGKNADGLNESVRTALEDSERVMREIKRTLRKGASTPHAKYDKGRVESHVPKIQQILDALHALTSPLGEDPSVAQRTPNPTFVDPHAAATTPVSESACRRLIGRAFSQHEFPALIEAIFSSENEGGTICSLPQDDAQTIIDVIDQALDATPGLSLWTRKRCLKLLYRTCGRRELLPTALKIPICYGQTGSALCKGGFADVWKEKYCGRDVAVKVIRIYSNSNLQKITGRFCKEVVTWKHLQHPNVLPLIGVSMSKTLFAMTSDWMVNGSISTFVKAHPNADRLGLLKGVAKGLIYIHDEGMIHGDLKGANILIDQNLQARLADFGLLTIISDPANLLTSSSYTQGGTLRWMSPELIDPQRFGFEKGHLTKSSDCYALGMVIYEIISGNLPFHEHANPAFLVRVLTGEHPTRGVGFPENLWKMLELCWSSHPNRPSIEHVLQCLEMVLNVSKSPLGMGEETGNNDDWGSANGYSITTYNGSSGMMRSAGVESSDSSYPVGRLDSIPYRAWEVLRKNELLPNDIREFVLRSLGSEPLPPASDVADCLLIIGLALGIELHTDYLLVFDKSRECSPQIDRIYERLTKTLQSPNPTTYEVDRALEAMELIAPLSGSEIAEKSYKLFHVVMRAPVSLAYSQEKKWEASRLAMYGAYKWDKHLPWVDEPKDILTFLDHHFDLATQGDQNQDEPIHNALRALAYASSSVTIEALKHFDPTEPSFVRGICYVYHNDKPFQLRKAALFFLPLIGDRWFNTPYPIMEPDRMRSLCVDWASVVDSIEHTHNVQKVTLAVLFGMINSPHWRPHIVTERWELLEYFTSVPDDSQPLRRCIDNPELMNAIANVPNPVATVHWLAILWLKYKELIPQVREQMETVTKEIARSGRRRNLDSYLSLMDSELEKAEDALTQYNTWSTDPGAVALRTKIENLQQARVALVTLRRG
ncbi:hypothetical protein BDM02DRAFT_3175321 [Thelephora ganbajun]|uniref:Uncharacterized protein n=1 Tax=Thelephora ganbajun TaxID=370292 RepID=A0ACB6Z2I3_THEGA|nr:hypothetical protein BDM02DRAFT_3175321 [Thelephora ganbajun]